MLKSLLIVVVLTAMQLSTSRSRATTGHSPSKLHHPTTTVAPIAGQFESTKATVVSNSNRCATGLPRGCSCSKNDGVSSITCSGVRLTAVPKHWDDAGNSIVETLNLERNNISEINIGDFFGVKIERLLLANNSLHELNFLSFWGLEYSLEILDLSYNQFRRVPFEALRLLRNLRSLSLTANKIYSLRDFDFGYMRKLEVLALDKNPITSIERHAFVGTQLSLLNFDGIHLAENLADLPTNDLGYVKGISLSNNGISSIPNDWFRNFKSLSYLNLDNNLINNLHADTFAGVENTLKILELNHNRLTDVPSEALQRLNVLESLQLSDNKIRRIHRRAFNSSNHLQFLDLSNNRLQKLSKRAFVGLEALEKIDLRHNRLITLDDTTFHGLKKVGRSRITVYIGHNPWLCNCIFRWVKDELDKKSEDDATVKQQSSHYSLFADEPICDRPKYVQGQLVSEVPTEDFTCDHDYYYYYYDNDSTNSPSENDLPVDNEDTEDLHNEVDEEEEDTKRREDHDDDVEDLPDNDADEEENEEEDEEDGSYLK